MKTLTPIVNQIESMGHYIRDMHNDGFSQFEVKKKLYKILWETQKQIHNSPNFVGENDWLKEHEEEYSS